MERTAVVLVEKLSPKELREHGYSLKVWGKTSEWQLEREPEESVVENEVPHFPSWEEGCIIWGRSLNSPWWPGVVCAPSHGEITDIPGCAWVRWPHFTDLDVVCNANIIEFKEGYSRFFSDRCTQKLYRKGVIENIKAVAIKSGIDITNWTNSQCLKWASNGFKHPSKGHVRPREVYNTRGVYNTQRKNFNNDN